MQKFELQLNYAGGQQVPSANLKRGNTSNVKRP
jgi:hypothetical protein